MGTVRVGSAGGGSRRGDVRSHLLFCGFIVLVAAFLRFWGLDLSQFDGTDDVRDWKRAGGILRGHEPWWRGPEAALSTEMGVRPPGGAYYLMLAAAYRLNRNPLSGFALVAALGSLGALLVYPLALLFVPRGTAAVVALLAATAPGWVLASRAIWNPNFVFPFAASFHLGLGLWHLRRKPWGALLAFASWSILLQLHLSALALLPLVAWTIWDMRRRGRLVALCLLAWFLPLAPSLAKTSREEWAATARLVPALTSMTRDGLATPQRRAFRPLSWPMPALPPLSFATYGAEYLDRYAASLLLDGDSTADAAAALAQYWKGPLSETIRSSSPLTVPAKLRAHTVVPAGLRVRFGLDVAASFPVWIALHVGALLLLVDCLRRRLAPFLVIGVVLMGVVGLVPGLNDTHHFFFVFYPLPVLLVGLTLARFGRFRTAATAAILAVALTWVVLLVDRAHALATLGGTPSVGVPHRYRVQAARWLKEHRCTRLGDVEVVGPEAPWTFFLRRGGGPPRYRVVEISDVALGLVCPSGPQGCLQRWRRLRDEWAGRMVFTTGGIWIYRLD